jgi:hypothetical protein
MLKTENSQRSVQRSNYVSAIISKETPYIFPKIKNVKFCVGILLVCPVQVSVSLTVKVKGKFVPVIN